MKYPISISAFVISLNLHAAGIYKCTSADGNITYSGKPCENEIQNIVREDNPKVSTNDKHQDNQVKRVFINSHADFDNFAKSLSFAKMSDILSGVSKNNFHGLNIAQLFQLQNIKYDDWNTGKEKLEFLVHIEGAFKLFASNYIVYVNGKDNHPFLDLTNDEISEKMMALGFGKPMIGSSEEYEWKWTNGNAKCKFSYRRSYQSQEKGFSYSCVQD